MIIINNKNTYIHILILASRNRDTVSIYIMTTGHWTHTTHTH